MSSHRDTFCEIVWTAAGLQLVVHLLPIPSLGNSAAILQHGDTQGVASMDGCCVQNIHTSFISSWISGKGHLLLPLSSCTRMCRTYAVRTG